MILIDGKKAAAELREELKKEVSQLKIKYNKVPGLTVILIGDLTPSQIYVKNKEKSAIEVGLKSDVIRYSDTVEEKTVLEKINELNKDESVSGILVQLPLPKHIYRHPRKNPPPTFHYTFQDASQYALSTLRSVYYLQYIERYCQP